MMAMEIVTQSFESFTFQLKFLSIVSLFCTLFVYQLLSIPHSVCFMLPSSLSLYQCDEFMYVHVI